MKEEQKWKVFSSKILGNGEVNREESVVCLARRNKK
jgi:hypothetical protein